MHAILSRWPWLNQLMGINSDINSVDQPGPWLSWVASLTGRLAGLTRWLAYLRGAYRWNEYWNQFQNQESVGIAGPAWLAHTTYLISLYFLWQGFSAEMFNL